MGYTSAVFADVAELVDAVDSKSTSSNRVLVRVQSSAKDERRFQRLFFFVISVQLDSTLLES